MSKKLSVLYCTLLTGCTQINGMPSADFIYTPIKTTKYDIATWQKINNPQNNHVHIYIEGDGNAYNAYGTPTHDPTPKGDLVRNLAQQDPFENVIYMTRPCQFITNDNCKQTDWTTGRFSQDIITAQTEAIKQTANNKNITLIGYSGGAMVSGLVIKQNPNMKFEKWITIAGVLNHKQWTEFFGDTPLTESLDMDVLPKISQTHFVGGQDKTVPYELSKKWTNGKNVILVPNATHNDFGKIKLFD